MAVSEFLRKPITFAKIFLKMKKTLPIILLSLCINYGAGAQGFYLRAGLGYAVPMPGEKIDQYGNILNGSASYNGSTIFSENLKNASFTSGLQGSIGGGLKAGKNVAVELNAFVNAATAKNTEMLTGRTNSSGQVYDYIAERQANGAVILNPAIVLQTSAAKWNVYSRTGLLLPVRTHMTLRETYYFPSGDVDNYTWDIHNYFSVGFNAATGVKVAIGKGATLWGEVNTMFLNIARKERDLNDLVINGRDYPLSQAPVAKTIYYSKNGVNSSASEQPALSQPFSSVGVNFGVSFMVCGNSKKS